MRLLVTGGSGFVGSNFIRYILQHYGPEWITNVDCLTTGRLANLEGVAENYGERYEFLHADVNDRDKLEALFEKHQFFAVVHFAAEASGAAGTEILLEHARQYGVRRFALFSRDGVEAMAPVEAVTLQAHREHGQEVVITRTTDCYGPFQPPSAFIPGIILGALSDRPVRIAGAGTRSRDWLHVEDFCAGAFTALLDATPGSVHHFASGHQVRDLELAQQILGYLGRNPGGVEFSGAEGNFGAHMPERRDAVVQSEGAEAVAGAEKVAWKPRHPFDEGLRETIDWYVRNREWWESSQPVR